jgi:hypothetical protein
LSFMPTTGTNEGDSLRAEKVVVNALKITRKGVFRHTGGHNSQFAVAERDVAVAERDVEHVIVKPMVRAKGTQ